MRIALRLLKYQNVTLTLPWPQIHHIARRGLDARHGGSSGERRV